MPTDITLPSTRPFPLAFAENSSFAVRNDGLTSQAKYYSERVAASSYSFDVEWDVLLRWWVEMENRWNTIGTTWVMTGDKMGIGPESTTTIIHHGSQLLFSTSSRISPLPLCLAAHREPLVDEDVVLRLAWFIAIPLFFRTQLLTDF